ncbi:hypothetical protein GGI25_004164 [Coemansia spiralis]|uniref:HMG box domain-containing protein n=2 Tax=Coemansia TaxID=4863 RepID=A0A9W8G612_9FUNG|nr:hypothetical protein BX070DRAFT_230702 [Coemansia spiralis]KAJ1987879.1 hypothetical protein EDC05_005610 [Coemansia umbellata]KAJ2620487.1 hypothetical protein GGI26_004975 [Coemansia sp. RSA 1358]KAJ2675016.1 hypothetical protein GGI25_004164 [Coemansia spiralis]
MDNYQQAYQKYPDMYQGQPVNALNYANIGGMPIINMSNTPMNSIPAFGLPTSLSIPKAPQTTSSSRVLSEPDCQIYQCNKDADPQEFSARQMISIEGRVFIEHTPGHSIIFVPNKLKPSQVMQQVSKKGKSRVDKPARPCNVFFKYRSHKLAELQAQFPKLNQTVISRMVAEHWKKETDDVKERFKLEYKEDMNKYEMAKRVRRSKSDADIEENVLTGATAIDLPFYGSLGLVDSPSEDGTAPRHRSFTLPVDDKQQIGISRLIH